MSSTADTKRVPRTRRTKRSNSSDGESESNPSISEVSSSNNRRVIRRNKNISESDSSDGEVEIPSRSRVKKSNLSSPTVLSEDLDGQILPLGEIVDFLKVTFGDISDSRYCIPVPSWEFDPEKHHPRGTFQRSEFSVGDVSAIENDESQLDHERLLDGKDMEEDRIADPLSTVADGTIIVSTILQTIFLFIQGILAGFSLSTVYLVAQTSSDTDLISQLQPNITEIRRFFFITSCVSVVGTLDVPQEEGGGSSSESRWIKSMGGLSVLLTPLALITFTCYFSGFICVLVMSANEVIIAQHGGYDTTGDDDAEEAWINEALSDDRFKSTLENWKSLVQIRTVFFVLGWIVNSIMFFIHQINRTTHNKEMKLMKEALISQKQNISVLHGDIVDNSMSPNELKHLIAVQKVALQRSEHALASYHLHM